MRSGTAGFRPKRRCDAAGPLLALVPQSRSGVALAFPRAATMRQRDAWGAILAAVSRSLQGTIASLCASVTFGAIFLLAKALRGLDATELVAWRLVATVPIIALMFTVMKLWPLVKQAVRRLDD